MALDPVAPPPDAVKVKRDGARGWHWICATRFDPRVHELIDPAPVAAVADPVPDAPRRRGRPPKQRI